MRPFSRSPKSASVRGAPTVKSAFLSAIRYSRNASAPLLKIAVDKKIRVQQPRMKCRPGLQRGRERVR